MNALSITVRLRGLQLIINHTKRFLEKHTLMNVPYSVIGILLGITYNVIIKIIIIIYAHMINFNAVKITNII